MHALPEYVKTVSEGSISGIAPVLPEGNSSYVRLSHVFSVIRNLDMSCEIFSFSVLKFLNLFLPFGCIWFSTTAHLFLDEQHNF